MNLAPRPWWRDPWCAAALAAAAACVPVALQARGAGPLPWDLAITRAVQAADLRVLEPLLTVLNRLGFPPFVDIVYSAIVVLIWRGGRRWDAIVASLNAAGGAGVNWGVKALVMRARPDPLLVHVEHHIAGSSFPAGHVLDFGAFSGFLAWLAYLRWPPGPRRTATLVTLMALVALMGLARIHAGEHWPSDVLGGALLGAFWLSVTVAIHRAGLRRRAAAPVGAASPVTPRPGPRPEPQSGP